MYMNKTALFLILSVWILAACGPDQDYFEEGFLKVDDHDIHYIVEGSGDPVLMLHGGYLSLDSWDGQVVPLKEAGYRCIRYDELGHGQTEVGGKITNGYEIVNAFAEEFGDDKISVIGLSWGGIQAVDFAINYPEKVEKLILVSPGMNGWDWFQDSIAHNNFIRGRVAIANGDTTIAIMRFCKNWVVGPQRDVFEVDEDLRQVIYDKVEYNYNHNWGKPWSVPDEDFDRVQLADIKVPTLILRGEHDVQDIAQITHIYAQAIPNAELLEISGVAHYPNMEITEQFNNIILEFLQE